MSSLYSTREDLLCLTKNLIDYFKQGVQLVKKIECLISSVLFIKISFFQKNKNLSIYINLKSMTAN